VNSEPGILLSDIIVTPLELGKIQRELFALDEFLKAENHGTNSGNSLPYTSPLLSNIIKKAGLNMLKTEDRQKLSNQLQFVRRTAPIVKISFASEPSKQALRVLVRWFRSNGHPNTLIEIGVVPGIGGGCIVTTSSKSFDFSLKKHFANSMHELTKQLV
jgi:F0F1-type ATP synthase delta subunit